MTKFKHTKDLVIVFVFVAIVLIFTTMRPTFILPGNQLEILRQVSFSGIVAVGLTFCLLTGGMDLSVGSNVAFGMTVCAMFMAAQPFGNLGEFNPNPIFGMVLCLVATTGVGMLNGFLINEVKIPALIVTLGTMQAVRGLVYVMTGAMPISKGFTDYFRFIGQGSIGGVLPVPVVLFVLVFIVATIVLGKTVFGRYVYGVGGNSEVARLSGINVKKMTYCVYSISGLLCGIAAIALLSRTNSCQPRAATGYEFEVVTACVLGGVSISGGEGKLFPGVFFGVLILGELFNGLIQIGLSEFYQMIFKGAVLVIAVGLDTMSKHRSTQSKKLRKLKVAA